MHRMYMKVIDHIKPNSCAYSIAFRVHGIHAHPRWTHAYWLGIFHRALIFWEKTNLLEKEGDFINAFDYIAIQVPSL